MGAWRRPSPHVVRFRSGIINLFCADRPRAHYIDRDRMVCVCPICDGWLAIRFAGLAPRVELECEHACHRHDIIRAILPSRHAG